MPIIRYVTRVCGMGFTLRGQPMPTSVHYASPDQAMTDSNHPEQTPDPVAWIKDRDRQRAEIFDFTADSLVREEGPEAYQAFLDEIEARERAESRRLRDRYGIVTPDDG